MQKLKICTISDHRFYTVTHLGQIIWFDIFGGILGVKKGQKLPISLKVTPRSCEFSQKHIVSPETWYCYSFRTNKICWSFLGSPWASNRSPKGSKVAYRANNNPQKLKICTYRQFLPSKCVTASNEKFDAVTHLIGYWFFFGLFLGHSRGQMGLKMQKIAYLPAINVKNY